MQDCVKKFYTTVKDT